MREEDSIRDDEHGVSRESWSSSNRLEPNRIAGRQTLGRCDPTWPLARPPIGERVLKSSSALVEHLLHNFIIIVIRRALVAG